MQIGVIDKVLEGGGRVIVAFPCGKTREYGLSRGRRMLEQPKVGMGLVHTDSGHLRFFGSPEEAQRVVDKESLK